MEEQQTKKYTFFFLLCPTWGSNKLAFACSAYKNDKKTKEKNTPESKFQVINID